MRDRDRIPCGSKCNTKTITSRQGCGIAELAAKARCERIGRYSGGCVMHHRDRIAGRRERYPVSRARRQCARIRDFGTEARTPWVDLDVRRYGAGDRDIALDHYLSRLATRRATAA